MMEASAVPRLIAVEVDEEHVVVSANAAFTRLFGLPQDKLLGLAREAVVYRVAEHMTDPEDFVRKTRVARGGPFMAHGAFTLAAPGSGKIRWLAKPLTGVAGRYRIREWFIRFE